jgi:hypothetical protein
MVLKWNCATRAVESRHPLPMENVPTHYLKIHPAPDGSLWVTANDPRVFRLADGEWREMWRAPLEMCYRQQDSVQFAGLTGGDYLLRWRCADGDWSEWAGQAEDKIFPALKPGEYTLQYEVMNKWLEVSPPAAVEFSIKYDVDKLTRDAAEKLFGENWDERDAAVKTLARFPEPARELLKKLAADRARRLARRACPRRLA